MHINPKPTVRLRSHLRLALGALLLLLGNSANARAEFGLDNIALGNPVGFHCSVRLQQFRLYLEEFSTFVKDDWLFKHDQVLTAVGRLQQDLEQAEQDTAGCVTHLQRASTSLFIYLSQAGVENFQHHLVRSLLDSVMAHTKEAFQAAPAISQAPLVRQSQKPKTGALLTSDELSDPPARWAW